MKARQSNATMEAQRRSPRTLLDSARMRVSPWRQRILLHFERLPRPMTARELFRLMQEQGEPINPPTLYRVIHDLESGGLILGERRGDKLAYRLAGKP